MLTFVIIISTGIWIIFMVISAKHTFFTLLISYLLIGCSYKQVEKMNQQKIEQAKAIQSKQLASTQPQGKFAVYQVFTRLFGNKNTTNKPWGTIADNGVGKFSDINDKALLGIKELGISHVWYTGVPHHGVINDYTQYGISNDDPDVIKGRAGSPYAVKDYYNVNPDLADDPANRLSEFEALITRTHQHNLKVIIDIVPNHVARGYRSLSKPAGVADFGEHDNTQVEYAKHNNFYYVVGEDFKVPKVENNKQPLGGENHPLANNKFFESPAKWTGNGARKAQPHFNDWYETVKINYGVKPDGSYDFPRLPENYRFKNYQQHFDFWQGVDVPNSWIKFKDIALYWLDKGVDGFRYDMSEMVPVEFWSYLNSTIKLKKPDAFLIAEIYNPDQYRNYIQLGKIDYLYDKVDFYDRIKDIIQGKGNTDNLEQIQQRYADIEQHLLHFLENHDEQRIASPDFAGNAINAMPAAVVSTLISRSPTLIYFGQEVGEDGSEETGFGDPTRTTIFDYAGVPAHQRWMNGGKFDGAMLSQDEAQLRDFYQRLMKVSRYNPAMNGNYVSLHHINRKQLSTYNHKHFAFARSSKKDKLVVIANFDSSHDYSFSLKLPATLIQDWQLTSGDYLLTELLYGKQAILEVNKDLTAYIKVNLKPLESLVYRLN